MYQNCCKKCGSIDLFTNVKGNNTGLYCTDCGGWIKWLSKDELLAFNNAKQKENITLDRLPNQDSKWIRTEIERFITYLDSQIDKELGRKPLSVEDSIQKCSTALAYERDKNVLMNIIDGKRWDENQ